MIVVPSPKRLRELATPQWREFPELPGIRVRMRGLTSEQSRVCTQRALNVIRSLQHGAEALETYGLAATDGEGGQFNPADPDQMAGLGLRLGSVEVLMEAISEWEGVFLDEGGEHPAPVDRPTLTALCASARFEQTLVNAAQELSEVLLREGKPSAT